MNNIEAINLVNDHILIHCLQTLYIHASLFFSALFAVKLWACTGQTDGRTDGQECKTHTAAYENVFLSF